jgi:hypothetical protein
MRFWIDFWAVFFFASLVLFTGIAVIVAIGGFFNIRTLFKGLRNRSNPQGGDGPTQA